MQKYVGIATADSYLWMDTGSRFRCSELLLGEKRLAPLSSGYTLYVRLETKIKGRIDGDFGRSTHAKSSGGGEGIDNEHIRF